MEDCGDRIAEHNEITCSRAGRMGWEQAMAC